MGKLVFPVMMAVLGAGLGAGAGVFLKPDPLKPAAAPTPEEQASQTGDNAKTPVDPGYPITDKDHVDAKDPSTEFVKLSNQFVIPVVSGDLVDSLVVMSLSIEVPQGTSESVYAREPKLRDGLLQVLFDHANMGGFSGTFTEANTLDVLRAELTEVARNVISSEISNVLIVDLVRQDV